MSIPLDRLYHYIESIAQDIRGDSVIIYRFYPHGSKKLEDLTLLKENSWVTNMTSPYIYCNDQEPLNYNFYLTYAINSTSKINQLLNNYGITPPDLNFRKGPNIYDKCLLIHSEQRSYNLKKYQENLFIPVYYWSHAIIALDWFRFANHTIQQKNVQKLFLIYNRAWAGTREYRLKFTDYLIKLNLTSQCQMGCNSIDPELGIHYNLHRFSNPVWRPANIIENYFPINTTKSFYSAEFDIADYETTDIEIVLETLFDDSRLHLTEKVLRPIACGQPFILSSTHGSLKYLRSYGFKTFSDIWDEDYDDEENSENRLYKIINLMQHITNWCPETRARNILKAQGIANYNKKHFFSEKFFNLIITELTTNLIHGLEEIETTNTSQLFFDYRREISKNPNLIQQIITPKENSITTLPRTRQDISKVVALARKYYMRSLKHNS